MSFQKSDHSILFKTDKGAVIQDDHAHQFVLIFNGRQARFKVQEFLQFKRSMDAINLEDLFLGEGPGIDVQIIHHQGSDQLFVFTLCEIIAVKELVQGAMAMLQLNRILNDRLPSLAL